jgi:hypothetical protein
MSKSSLLKLYLLIGALECVLVLWFVGGITSDPRNAVFLGYSVFRLVLLAFIVLILGIFITLLVWANLSRPFSETIVLFVDEINSHRSKRWFLSASCIFLLTCAVVIFLIPSERLGSLSDQVERLAPVLYLSAVIALQSLIVQFAWTPRRVHWENLGHWKFSFYIAGGVLAILGILSAWMARTGIGLLPEMYGWHFPGTPILFSQLFLAWLAALPFVIWENPIEKWLIDASRFFRLDPIIFFVLWAGAFLIWWGQPMTRESYFTPEPTPPNFEYYPYSDAAFYDQTSQIILIGEGRSNEVVLRPLYIFFLAVLHLMGGQQYQAVIFLQTLFLAVMPAFAFLLASRLGGRPLGIMTAILIIVRERNAIALTNIIEVTHSKLLLSDVPTMALMILAVYVYIIWLEKRHLQPHLGVMAGASFGLVVLVRSQAQLLLAVLIIGMVFSGGFQMGRALQRVAIFLLGFVLVVTPWVVRNYQVSGQPAIENTEFYMRLFAGGYAEPTDVLDILPGESTDEYNARIRLQIVRYVLNHPLEIGRIYATYFLHNEISSVVYFPLSVRLYDLQGYVAHMPFWENPKVTFGAGSGLMFVVTLAIMAFGIGTAARRAKFLGVMPLLIHFGYSLSVVPARISGWRYVLPVDWIPQLYYSLGLIQLALVAIALISNRLPESSADDGQSTSPALELNKLWVALAASIICGLSLPMLEASIPPRYPVRDQVDLVRMHTSDALVPDAGDVITASMLEGFLEMEPRAIIVHGRALYPAYHGRGEFWGDDSPNLIEASRYDRIQFNVIGSEEAFVYLPLNVPPEYFPNASDVFIVACRQETSLQALWVQVGDRLLVSSTYVGLTCPVNE